MPRISYPEDLPISQRRAEILAAIQAHQVVVVAGETGSGKTTQIPKMCLEAGLAKTGRIGCTQPRRVAALSVSRRVAEELEVSWGREVGCKMRFNDDTSRDTQIKFMTDGILLAEIQSDPLLRAYSMLILDEAHERSLNIDFLLGYLQGLLAKRSDLKLLITSATIDTETFSKAFGNAPVIEVSGRLWPVEIRYQPLETFAPAEDPSDELTHIAAAVRAAEDALLESHSGDLLIFMPTEREIRETLDLLEGSLGSSVDVLALYGRMPAAEQQRIFEPGPKRRIIISTNIAETSLTLPRVRYVIDTGLARISRYNPRTRTKRLPVEPVAQSSANQRAGRAGRVQDGICIRLYSEEDFLKRPRFAQPEIQRANLAEVILRMKAFRLGEIESFPFLNPPVFASIRAGYRLLHELGALTETNELTPLGRELAQLPVDPTLGRMLLQSLRENALAEVLVIAAGLSVPDPRERPDDAREAAENAHAKFRDPDSDFLSLLNLWNAAPNPDTKGSGNALRRFCKTHFLSVTRMREWRDIHRQLAEAITPAEKAHAPRNAPGPRPSTSPGPGGKNSGAASYTAVHRSILAGLLSHVAQRSERNIYKAAGGRQVTLFPGSNLYERREKPRKGPRNTPDSKAAPAPPEKTRQPQWIMAGEIVETSQLFARMAAGIHPDWILDLAKHLLQFRYQDPRWTPKASRVLVSERAILQGLEISRRQIDHGHVDPAAATDLFIREALVPGEFPIALRFFEHNRQVREKVETALTRVRSGRAMDLDQAMVEFYAARIHNVSSVHDLHRLVQDRLRDDPKFLCMQEEDLHPSGEPSYDRSLFPDSVPLGNTALPVTYSFDPGEETDGVTVRVPLPVASQLSNAQLQWMIPGLREEQISILLRALPKPLRKTLLPLEPKIPEVAREFMPGQGDFLESLAHFLTRKYRIHIRASDWPALSLPPHLQPRVEVVDRRNQTLAAGRDLESVRSQVEQTELPSRAWDRAAQRWEKKGLRDWSFGDLPESVLVEEIAGTPLQAFPALEEDPATDSVHIRLVRSREEAETLSRAGFRRLARIALAKDLAQTRRELEKQARQWLGAQAKSGGFQNALHQLSAQVRAPQAASHTPEGLAEDACENLIQHTLSPDPALPLTRARFLELTEAARRELPRLGYQLSDWARQILAQRQAVLASSKRYPGLEEDTLRLVPPHFLRSTPYLRLPHVLRYLRAIVIRGERAVLNPRKDAERAAQLAPYRDWQKRVPEPKHEQFRWLLEEFRVSLFAQELGTAQPASAARLNALGGF
ncbi:MAG: ATP-dependent helicase HrpA [Verrucomicrobiota bacterium]